MTQKIAPSQDYTLRSQDYTAVRWVKNLSTGLSLDLSTGDSALSGALIAAPVPESLLVANSAELDVLSGCSAVDLPAMSGSISAAVYAT